MKLRTLSLLFIIAALLTLVELGLEFRASRQGWDTILFGPVRSLGEEISQDEHALYGPQVGFPFRSFIVPAKRPEGLVRIWVSSSSYGEDNYVAPDKIFPNIAGSRLKTAGVPNQILNASRAGFGIWENIEQLKDIGMEWQPDFVIFYQMYHDINFLDKLSESECSDLDSIVEARNRDVTPADDVSWPVRLVEQTTTYALLKNNFTPFIARNYILRPRVEERVVRAFEALVRRFISRCDDLGAQPVLMTFASSHRSDNIDQMSVRIKNWLLGPENRLSIQGWVDTVERLNGSLENIAREEDVRLIDLAEVMSGEPRYFRDFVHFSVEGHAVAGRVIADDLARFTTAVRPGGACP